MYWQCDYHDSKGIRCGADAIVRIHFSSEHPFDHVDACMEHTKEYQRYSWYQLLREDKEDADKGKSKQNTEDSTSVLTSGDRQNEAEEGK